MGRAQKGYSIEVERAGVVSAVQMEVHPSGYSMRVLLVELYLVVIPRLESISL